MKTLAAFCAASTVFCFIASLCMVGGVRDFEEIMQNTSLPKLFTASALMNSAIYLWLPAAALFWVV